MSLSLRAAAVALAFAFAILDARPGLAEPAALAVLDFAMAEESGEPDPWSLGLADYFEAQLQKHGAQTLERRELRRVLDERRLDELGLVAARTLVRQKLPWVRFLLRGEIEARDEERFALVLRAVDTQTGREVWSRRVSGRYPDDVARLLDELAGATLAGLPQQAAPTVPVALPGFTRSPELALLFYKGLDHLVRGRPEFAEEYFRHAARTERGFWLASVWRMRSLEALGLDDLAGVVRDRLIASQAGPELLRALAPSFAHQKRELVVAVTGRASGAGADEAMRELEGVVRERLSAHPALRVLSTRWIRSLAAELDLRLSGDFDSHALAAQPWFGADAVLHIALPQAGAGRLALELVDAVSGRVIARVEGASSSAEKLVDALAAQRKSVGKARGWRFDPAARPLAPLDYAGPDHDIGIYKFQTYAYLLRAFADDPRDPVKLLQHEEVHSIHSYAEYVPGTYDHEWPYLERLWRRLLSGIDAEDPEAPRWLSHALWNLRLRGSTSDGDRDHPSYWFNRGRPPLPPLEQHFEPLLRDHPETFAADCVRYAIAFAHARAGRHGQALAQFLPLIERLPTHRDPELDYELIANLYFATAFSAERSGRLELARRYADRALQAVEDHRHYGTPASKRAGRENRGGPPVQSVAPALVYQVPMRGGRTVKGGWYVAGAGKMIIDRGKILYRRGQSIEVDIANFQARLGGGAVRQTLAQVYRRVELARGDEAVTARIAFLEQLARDTAHGVTLGLDMTFGRPEDTILPVLVERATPAQRKIYERALREILNHLAEPPYRLELRLRARLLITAGLLDEASALVKPWFQSRSHFQRRVAATTQAKVLRARHGPARAAAFLAGEITRFEGDFETARGMRYLDLIYACAQAHEDAGAPARAVELYARALAQPLFADDTSAGDQADHHRASLRFRSALAVRTAGDPLEAAALLRQVLESAETHPDWMIHYSGGGAHTIDTLRLYQAAQRELERLRASAPASR